MTWQSKVQIRHLTAANLYPVLLWLFVQAAFLLLAFYFVIFALIRNVLQLEIQKL